MFTISSKDVSDGGTASLDLIDDMNGCTGHNRSPQLAWNNVPAGTKSFAITLHDPDAPRKGGWWHWLVFDLPATTADLATGAGNASGRLLPKGSMQLVNDSGERGYSGPCPPPGHGTHHYFLTLHALKVEQLGLNEFAAPLDLVRAIAKQELASARLMFMFGR
jgi:Raf kinase inhibitor-like YbhB/YbcL family protein